MSFSIQFINLLDSISETRANEVRRTLLHKTSLSSLNTVLLEEASFSMVQRSSVNW